MYLRTFIEMFKNIYNFLIVFIFVHITNKGIGFRYTIKIFMLIPKIVNRKKSVNTCFTGRRNLYFYILSIIWGSYSPNIWGAMCDAKNRGVLGLKNLFGFNISLLRKHVWKCIQQPDILVSRVLRVRYFSHDRILEAGKGNHSYWWAVFVGWLGTVSKLLQLVMLDCPVK